MFTIEVKNRDKLIDYLKSKKLQLHLHKPLPLHPLYKNISLILKIP